MIILTIDLHLNHDIRGLQRFCKTFNSMKSGCWQGNAIRSLIRTLVVNGTPIFDFSQDVGKSPVETVSDAMVIGAVRALCEFTLLVSQQNHSDLSLAALEEALQRFQIKRCAFRDQKM
jgi:hypothetical protein